MNLVKDEAMEIVRNLPEDASWDDVMYEFYAKQKILRGLEDIEKGKVYSHEEVKKRLGL